MKIPQGRSVGREVLSYGILSGNLNFLDELSLFIGDDLGSHAI